MRFITNQFRIIALGAAIGVLTATLAMPASGAPSVVATSPTDGATGIDPGLTEITVTFDQDMAGGMSWTGGGPEYPPSPAGTGAEWRDKRTCVLPVKLEPGHHYRVGINSPSFRNFRSVAGESAATSSISFTTKGTKAGPPRIIALKPKNGATDVDPAMTEITVTFDQDMGGGMSWTGGGPEFPTSPEGARAQWRDKRTCVLPVKLERGHHYRVGINSPSFRNFRSASGQSVEPVSISFTTM